ncbi:hypothetical protein CROQUDRAFT_101276 [Cronartium quercuum f. sp. fusiforme G11]|uniref:Retrovirus-related Pol polyprotein from transposon TNT 1-94-like beta-barrel domain-containing protein n=1 Tax=Cronartium quercuum f. sp. fusiforme G11 TaxID=708437 RepID=A0A9P6T6P4_9BASI|nr:hypothetical protein CROQUDRAFT_101276 [Cronartium quercuum f. sp. fusiforme G11]
MLNIGTQSLAVKSTGNVEFADDEGGHIIFKDAIFVPELNKNLIAGGALVEKGVTNVINLSNPNIFALTINNC